MQHYPYHRQSRPQRPKPRSQPELTCWANPEFTRKIAVKRKNLVVGDRVKDRQKTFIESQSALHHENKRCIVFKFSKKHTKNL